MPERQHLATTCTMPSSSIGRFVSGSLPLAKAASCSSDERRGARSVRRYTVAAFANLAEDTWNALMGDDGRASLTDLLRFVKTTNMTTPYKAFCGASARQLPTCPVSAAIAGLPDRLHCCHNNFRTITLEWGGHVIARPTNYQAWIIECGAC